MIITIYGKIFFYFSKNYENIFRETVTTVELLLLRILEFKIPEADFFSYLVKFLYSLEKWCHGRQCEANQDTVKLFQAVSRSQGVKLIFSIVNKSPKTSQKSIILQKIHL